MRVNILEAKNRLSQLIKSALAGEEVIIANRGEPVVRLVAVRSPAPHPEGNGRSLVDWLNENRLPAHLQRTHEEIEANIRQQRDAWD